ncbi:MAG: hypothetical protein F6K58_15800 [Symploca sp. SIO2E9]|nr:hypothetical protein [Symploca sp. SIO2E9]
MSEKRCGARSKQTLQTRRGSRRGEFKSHAKFRSPAKNQPATVAQNTVLHTEKPLTCRENLVASKQ